MIQALRKSNLRVDIVELDKTILASVGFVTVVYGDKRLTGS
jgi:hypothetical protein